MHKSGRAGLAHFAIRVPSRRGPAALGGRQTIQRDDPQKHSFGCLHSASTFGEGTGFFWNFGCRMGEGDGAGQCLCSLMS